MILVRGFDQSQAEILPPGKLDYKTETRSSKTFWSIKHSALNSWSIGEVKKGHVTCLWLSGWSRFQRWVDCAENVVYEISGSKPWSVFILRQAQVLLTLLRLLSFHPSPEIRAFPSNLFVVFSRETLFNLHTKEFSWSWGRLKRLTSSVEQFWGPH